MYTSYSLHSNITYGGWLAYILEMHYAFLPVWIIAFISEFTYIDACADSRHIWKEMYFEWLIEQRRFLVLISLFFKISHITVWLGFLITVFSLGSPKPILSRWICLFFPRICAKIQSVFRLKFKNLKRLRFFYSDATDATMFIQKKKRLEFLTIPSLLT